MPRRGSGRLAADFISSVLLFEMAPDAARTQRQGFRNQLRGLLDAFNKRASAEGVIAQEVTEASRFLVYWADERIIHSNWAERELWERDSLQYHLYGTTDGGKDFWERLSRLPPDYAGAREVALFCLANGFAGEFVDDPGRLQQATQHTLQMVRSTGQLVDLDRCERLSAPAYDTEIDLPSPQGSGVMRRLLFTLLLGLGGFAGFWLVLRILADRVPEAPV